MFQRRLKQTRVQTLSIGKCYELLFQSNIYCPNSQPIETGGSKQG